jgi:hypothetical protein
LVHFTDIWSILRTFGIFYVYLVYFVVIWNKFSRFGMLYQEKSGNPAPNGSHLTICCQNLRPKRSSSRSDVLYTTRSSSLGL